MRKKKNEEKDFEQKLSEVEFPECDDGHSKREKEIIDLLKQIVNEYVRTSHVLTNQNEQVIQLLTKLKERFILAKKGIVTKVLQSIKVL